MKLYTVKSEGISHNSYMIIDDAEAAVIDPRRDCRIYLQIAQKECAKIRYILETHRNEDFVVGSKELQYLSNAEICHSKELAFRYGDHNLNNNETFKIGTLNFRTMSTPGHTNESICYILSSLEKSSSPLMVFTGDTLFVGSVGRTDLQGKANQPDQAAKLFDSLHEKIMQLDEGVIIYPAHGAGSICGNEIGEQAFSTIGYEKKTNPYLNLEKNEFVQQQLTQELIVPPYFIKMENYNLEGAPKLMGFPSPKPLNVAEFESEMTEKDSIIIDTRMPYAFSGSHVSNSLNVWLGGGTSVYSGWLLSYDQRILLVLERKNDLRHVLRHLWRLGFGNVYGFLCLGINEWQKEGKPISNIRTLSATDLKERISSYIILDVREPKEWHQDGIIKGAQCVFFGDLQKEADNLNRNKRYAVICSSGNRSSIAASILKRKGFSEVYNVMGGMMAWERQGYPTTIRKKI